MPNDLNRSASSPTNHEPLEALGLMTIRGSSIRSSLRLIAREGYESYASEQTTCVGSVFCHPSTSEDAPKRRLYLFDGDWKRFSKRQLS
jgi:hypothetical protein